MNFKLKFAEVKFWSNSCEILVKFHPFLSISGVGDVRVDDQRHLMFATDTQLDLLRRARRWYMDGTFKIRKEPFIQLWSVHAFLQKDGQTKQVSLLFVLVSRQRARDYVQVLRPLQELLGDSQVEGVVMDFEAACWNAVKEVFPDVAIHGCSFHWGQAVMRKVSMATSGSYLPSHSYPPTRSLQPSIDFLPWRLLQNCGSWWSTLIVFGFGAASGLQPTGVSFASQSGPTTTWKVGIDSQSQPSILSSGAAVEEGGRPSESNLARHQTTTYRRIQGAISDLVDQLEGDRPPVHI
ncbi:uncharacterized protein [Argopecten irradians]|uniref:uncharacterized protein n=1 Tax=Argopecten irradians TaxID=31199 RepID=UPI00371B4A28